MTTIFGLPSGSSPSELKGSKGLLRATTVAIPAGPLSVRPPRCPLRQRAKLWELHPSMHCSVIGTCMTTGELRSVMARVLGREVSVLSDHDLHKEAVATCSQRDAGAKLLHKVLDRRHHAAVNRFGQLRSEDAVMALWNEERKAGNIPGAYWAVMTHPEVGEVGTRSAFGDVHMLSHLVGAANRADIRRLAALEEENAALAVKVTRQQQRLQEAIAARDSVLRQFAALSANSKEAASASDPDDAVVALRHVIDDLQTRLGAEISRRERLEHRDRETVDARREWETRARGAEANAAALQRELEVLEFDGGASDARSRLPGECILYVGGRPATVDQARELLRRAGGELLSHDGGRHDHPSLLAGLIGRADRVVFPVDCISHDAALSVKRICRQIGKSWIPLRSSGLASFLAGPADAIPQPTDAAGGSR